MNEDGRKFALEKVEGLETRGCTNLWDGLKTGLDTMKKGNFHNNIIFFQ